MNGECGIARSIMSTISQKNLIAENFEFNKLSAPGFKSVHNKINIRVNILPMDELM